MPKRLPRVNVTVTEEQHALLLELAELNGGSASGYLRQMLDHATPLLRATVPMLRMAAQEMNVTREKARAALDEAMMAIRQVTGDALNDFDPSDPLPGAPTPSVSEGGRAKQRSAGAFSDD